MNYTVQVNIDEEKLERMVDKAVKKMIGEHVRDACKEYTEMYMNSWEIERDLKEVAQNAIYNSVSCHLWKKVNESFQNLEDKLARVCLNKNVMANFDTDERSFYQGLYAAYLTKNQWISESVWNEEIQNKLLDMISDKIIRGIQEGDGNYRRISCRLSQDYKNYKKLQETLNK